MSFRIDGVTYPGVRLDAARCAAFVGQVRTLVEAGSADPHFRVQMPTIGHRFTVRVRDSGEGDQETLALRICADVETLRRFDGLGFSEGTSAKLRKALEEARGLIVVASPEGMGARTTVYAALDLMDPFSRNIVTFERPVTGTLASIEQNDMDKLGRPLSAALQEKLRQDVDVVMLSEITEEATGLVALMAGQREHLVMARLALPDSVSVVEHLLGMGLDPGAIAKGLHTVVAQRLVRVLCERCRAQTTPSAELLHRIGKDPRQVEFLWEESEGCEACGMTGFHGRTGIFEIWQPGEESRRLIAAKATAEQLHASARHDGIQTLQQAGLEKALEGTTSLKEIARVIKHHR
jgi:type II secretory ATPase GspE/PulE/Tfp pilus assembly ATPase PilB-like protein